MRFNCGADLRPTRGVDPDTAIFYRELRDGWIFHKFWNSRRARLPFFAVGAGDQFCKTRGDECGRVVFAVAFDRRTQELSHAMKDLHCSISVVPPRRITAG